MKSILSDPAAVAKYTEVSKDILVVFNSVCGTSANSIEDLCLSMLPKEIGTLFKLCKMYEAELLSCQESEAFFSGSILGACMIEGLLACLCLLNEDSVSSSQRYQRYLSNRSKITFERAISSMGLGDLADVALEMNWIPADIVSEQWRPFLSEVYLEIAAERTPNRSKVARAENAEAIRQNSGYCLLVFLNMLRDRAHPGRWLKEGHQLESPDAFAGWSRGAMLASGELRNCLLARFMNDAMTTLVPSLLTKIKVVSKSAP